VRFRRFGLWALRGGTLSVSIGLVGLLMFRASTGCSNQGSIAPETSGSDVQAAGSAAAPGGAASAEDGAMYFPASKSEGGTGTRLLKPDTSTSAKGEEGSFFPGSKMGPVRPMPPPQQNPPPQQQNQAPSQ
jgi:hypothetical protein